MTRKPQVKSFVVVVVIENILTTQINHPISFAMFYFLIVGHWVSQSMEPFMTRNPCIPFPNEVVFSSKCIDCGPVCCDLSGCARRDESHTVECLCNWGLRIGHLRQPMRAHVKKNSTFHWCIHGCCCACVCVQTTAAQTAAVHSGSAWVCYRNRLHSPPPHGLPSIPPSLSALIIPLRWVRD